MRFFYGWFTERLDEGYVLVRNPMNPRQVSRVPLNPEVVDCIVFWTKDPRPAMDKLGRLEPYPYYIQFTINPYGNDIERNLPPKNELLDTFKRLADGLGPDRVVWRYSPVLYTEKYTEEYHIGAFSKYAGILDGSTKQCKLSFLDMYSKIKKRMADMGIDNGCGEKNTALAQKLADIGRRHGIEVSACGNIDNAEAGIPLAKCIDDRLISKITGYSYGLKKDTGQRSGCYCVSSFDIGAYDTCANGCQYCYANFSESSVRKNLADCDPHSPMLCGSVRPQDRVTERRVSSDRIAQLSLFPPE
jgi:hypothetical protein